MVYTPKQMMAFRVDKELKEKIALLAKLQDRTLSATIVHLIRVGLGLSSPLTLQPQTEARRKKSA
jgi:hypothetical protein